MKIGVIFGGPSREREISFAGGRTVYDNLNKDLFEPIPIFVDSNKEFILLDWEFVYKGTIRDFYPPSSHIGQSINNFQIYIESLGHLDDDEYDELISKVGRRLKLEELSELMDFAFLALHGHFGEDGQIQGLLESLSIPYSGSGILPSSLGINKLIQKKIMSASGFRVPEFSHISFEDWHRNDDKQDFFDKAIDEIGLPLVIKPSNQGSSLGVSVLEDNNLSQFNRMIDKAFFIQRIKKDFWVNFSEEEKIIFVRDLTDIRSGIGLPLSVNEATLYHPDALLDFIDHHFSSSSNTLTLEALDAEHTVLLEAFIKGKEFSCIVIKDEKGLPLALPPTEIVKGQEVFDYRSKYLAGLSRKETPINIDAADIEKIRKECEKLFELFEFNVYARIDGFINDNGKVFLNDPNTTSGMLPSSFFFHQAAEIGLNPSQFLTYLIKASIKERISTALKKEHYRNVLQMLTKAQDALKEKSVKKIKVAIFMGGFSSERHISVESGRNIYEKLASSSKYEPIPVFVSGSVDQHFLHLIPINLLLKDNADDITSKLEANKAHELIEKIKLDSKGVINEFAYKDQIFFAQKVNYDQLAQRVDAVFIALHGRPGEDGTVQKELEKRKVPYNGSGVKSSKITINKYLTNQELKKHGLKVFDQYLPEKEDWLSDQENEIDKIEKKFSYPLIAKPVDDGCSSAVKVISNKIELKAFGDMIFRESVDIPKDFLKVLNINPKEEIPQKNRFLVEEMVAKGDANKLIEITGGLTTSKSKGATQYEIFEPSEAVASKGILSLEEKFLAGEGQNITPARFDVNDISRNSEISAQVRAKLEQVAKILNIEGYARIDAFVKIYDDKVEILIIEVNSLPGMTPATCIFHQAAISGYKPFDFIDKILSYGIGNVKQNIHA